MATLFCLPPTPRLSPRRARTTCALQPPDTPTPHEQPLPLARRETATLLERMLAIALREQDFLRAAAIRDARQQLRRSDPTHALREALDDALGVQDFVRATSLRDEIELVTMRDLAERAKPRFPMGLVVRHRRLGHRMIVFGVDYRCRAPRRKAEDAGVGFSRRGEDQPWYHAAVDERDKTSGDNIVYVAEDDLVAAGEGVEVKHPITRIMFRGLYAVEECPGYTCYVPGSRSDADEDD